ncbi:DUF881 domain-containing protein [Bacillus sp. Marseille-Q3570]|uniref:DUF881 domain-containing protein n=1 Tax=Bacillus sp. Marseille-Q3570 TaxID=2963522 RepID=UPI0021B821CC|nr:DUF881 domain-containing protein [Bacillus sp. Marseille-Q3570]
MKRRLKFFIMTMIVGFMLAVQFHTNQEPVVRDTRDIWELRNDLESQKQVQQELYAEIYKYEQLIDEYSGSDKKGQLETLELTLADLKKDAGLTEVSGQGIELTIEPLLNDEDLVGKPAFSIHPELLRRLINELNSYGAEEIAIDGERIINTTPIREVNGKTYINDKPISPIPIKIKVLSRDPGKLHTEMLTSQSGEDFARENLLLSSELVDEVSLPPYNQQLRVKFMKEKEDT